MFAESTVSMTWFSSRKPYKNNPSYDLPYLKICREVFLILSDHSLLNQSPLNMFQCRELAYVLTSYFEDVVNGIGFWAAVVKEHEVLYGQRVPFFSKEQLEEWEDCNDIHPADIHYLAFVYLVFLQKTGQTEFFPSEDFFIVLREKVFDHLDQIEEITFTDFYKQYLMADAEPIDFKRILTWFAYDGYLFGYEFKHKREAHEKLLREQGGATLPKEYFDMNLFSELEKKMYGLNSCLSGLFPVDILATSLGCNEEKTIGFRNTKYLIYGIFEFFDADEKHFFFRHSLTDEVFPIIKKGVGNLGHRLGKEKFWGATLYRWQDSYIIVGICGHEPDKDEIFWMNKQNEYEYKKHSVTYQQELKNHTKTEAERNLAFFGEGILVYKTIMEFKEAMNKFHQWQFDVAVKEGRADANKNRPVPLRADHLPAMSDIGVFVLPDEPLTIIPSYYDNLAAMSTLESVYDCCERRLFLNQLFPEHVWRSLRSEAVLLTAENSSEWTMQRDKDLEALLRIYVPSDYIPFKRPGIMPSKLGFN